MKALSKILAAHDGFCEYMEVSFASEFEAFDELALWHRRACLAGLAGCAVDDDFALESGGGEGGDFVFVVQGVDEVSEFVYARHRV